MLRKCSRTFVVEGRRPSSVALVGSPAFRAAATASTIRRGVIGENEEFDSQAESASFTALVMVPVANGTTLAQTF